MGLSALASSDKELIVLVRDGLNSLIKSVRVLST